MKKSFSNQVAMLQTFKPESLDQILNEMQHTVYENRLGDSTRFDKGLLCKLVSGNEYFLQNSEFADAYGRKIGRTIAFASNDNLFFPVEDLTPIAQIIHSGMLHEKDSVSMGVKLDNSKGIITNDYISNNQKFTYRLKSEKDIVRLCTFCSKEDRYQTLSKEELFEKLFAVEKLNNPLYTKSADDFIM